MNGGFLLPHPWEPLLLQNAQEIAFRVRQYQLGEIEIKPKGASSPKRITALRVWPDKQGKPAKAPWYDLTYTQLQATMLPFLENPQTMSSLFHIKVNGYGVRKNFTVTVSP